MKKNIIMFAVGVLTQQVMQAQGTTYLSNLGQTSTGSDAVGSDSWQAASFRTGNNAGGYMLNSVQLAMTDASGSPSGFMAMIYSGVTHVPMGADFIPGSNMGTLDGSLNPAAGGVFTYTDDSNMILSPSTVYFIVLTAGTAVANGAYEWSFMTTHSYNPSGGWSAPYIAGGFDIYKSSDGSSWSASSNFTQYAITATAVPEPSTLGLLALGGLSLLWHRRKAKAV